jgi:hypothetical protein
VNSIYEIRERLDGTWRIWVQDQSGYQTPEWIELGTVFPCRCKAEEGWMRLKAPKIIRMKDE